MRVKTTTGVSIVLALRRGPACGEYTKDAEKLGKSAVMNRGVTVARFLYVTSVSEAVRVTATLKRLKGSVR